MAKEKNLTTVTTVAAADFARLVTSAGASVKATAANLAKYIIETYNGSTVAGSAQSVKSALDSLNSKAVVNSPTIRSGSVNDLKEYGVYQCNSSVTDGPTSGWLTVMTLPAGDNSASYGFQLAFPLGTSDLYIRKLDNGTWGAWSKK